MRAWKIAGRDAPELFCLITDLHDDVAYPARLLAQAYHWRWIGSETCLKEAKSAISGAGPSTGPMLRSASPALVRQEHAAWVTAVELARPAALTRANGDTILAGLARRRIQVDRHRHRDRKTKARLAFPPGGPRLATRAAAAQISVCQPLTA